MLDDEVQRSTKSAVPEPVTVPAAGAEFELELVVAIAGTALLSAMPAGAASKKADGGVPWGVPWGSPHPPP
jgi:hypothetical protein